jgi:signal transduction histidine kinase
MRTHLRAGLFHRLFLLFILIGFATSAARAVVLNAKDTVRLDSIQRLIEFYDRQGDYEQAYGQAVVYTDLRTRLQQQNLDGLVKQYEQEFADNALENARVNLLKQQALMELDQVEKEVQTTRLRRQQDSITLMNQQLDRQNKATINDIAYKQLRQKEDEQQQLMAQNRSRLLAWAIFNVVVLVLLLLLGIYVRNKILNARRLKMERKRAVDAMEQAQADNQTQNRFLLNLNREIRQPVDDIVLEARIMSGDADEATKTEAVKRMQERIHQLLTQVENVITKSGGASGEKLMAAVAALLMLAATALPAAAQHNPYGIRDDFYEYFRKADMMIQDERVPAMADTLIERARKAGDGLTMCLGYDLHVGHSYFTYDVATVKAAQAKQAACALATGYHKYIFFGWNRVILTYLNNKDFVGATEETHRYQEEAVRLNNAYGISRGYYYMGDIFKARGMLLQATQQYQLAVDFLVSHDERAEISSAYARLGEACTELGDYEKAERCLKLGVENARVEYEKINPNLGLLALYVATGQVDKARQVIPELERLKGLQLLMGNRNTSYLNSMVKFYLLTGETDKALFYLDSIGNRHPRTKYLTYAAAGDYQKALQYTYDYNRAAAMDDATMDAARLAALKAEYDNHLKERANNELALQNALLRTEQLKAEQTLGVEQNRQDSLLITHSNLQEDAEEAALILQRTEEQTAYEKMKHEQVVMRYKRNTVIVLTVLMLGIIAFLVWKTLANRRNAAQWQRQKEEAEKATELALEAGLRKKNFLEQITHELRTPLNAVQGFSEVLCDEEMCKQCSPEELADFRQRIADGAESLKALVDSSLELCAIEGGERKAQKRPFNLHALFHQLNKEYTPRVKSGVLLHTFVRPGTTMVDTDETLLKQAMELLLDNAVKFTERGHIDVRYELQSRLTCLYIEDTGCGIPPEKAEDIFRHFEKVDSFIPGIGLGLSLCRSIVTLLGGEVFLDTNYKEGSRFVIRLPR